MIMPCIRRRMLFDVCAKRFDMFKFDVRHRLSKNINTCKCFKLDRSILHNSGKQICVNYAPI